MMFRRIRTGWQLTKAALKVLQQDKELILYPLCAAFGILCIIILFFFIAISSDIIVSLTTISLANSARYIFITLFLLAAYIVSIFFEAAIISATLQRCEGKNPTFSSGLSLPAKKIISLILFAMLLTLVTIFIQMIRNLGRGKSRSVQTTSKISASALETGWHLLSFFVIPAIIIENLSIFKAIQRSKYLFVKTWGENITTHFTTGALFFVLILLGILPLIGAIVIGNSLLIAITSIVLLIWTIVIILFSTTINGILVALLYIYATDRRIPKKYGITQEIITKQKQNTNE